MNILYISAVSSMRLIDEIFHRTGTNPGFAVQKFGWLLLKGFSENACLVRALSNPPVTKKSHPSLFINLKEETENLLKYKYIPFINIAGLKHVCIFIYAFFYVLFWGLTRRKDKVIVCDTLSISACWGSLLATKINRITSVGVVTDIYGNMYDAATKKNVLMRVASRVFSSYINGFNLYVLLTEQMNVVANKNNHPYIVMEALASTSINDEMIVSSKKAYPKTILYAGGLYVKYGIKNLVEAFLLLNRKDTKLVLYGDGDYVSSLKELQDRYNTIEYRGVRPNSEIIKAELEATLLVNPRMTSDAFAKYSFPSKNMEYMVSGTPVLTTNLPGMPEEYKDYVYIAENDTVEGLSRSLSKVLSLIPEILGKKGLEARKFVLENKNYILQAKRIKDLIEQFS